jgi:hypothetical protein
MPILALSLAICGVPATASAAEPQPDAAPQAPAVSPDPAPGAGDVAPPQQSDPSTPVPVAPQAPATSDQPVAPVAPAAPPPASTAQQTRPKPKPNPRPNPTRARRDTPASRSDRRSGPADPGLLRRVDSFLPGAQADEGPPSHRVLLAAAALLALVMASGSMSSIAARVSRRPLR